MPRNKQSEGFTIVELLIVIIVIGILAAITIVAYNGVQQRAKASVLSSTLSSAAKSAQAAYLTTGDYPAASTLPTNQGIRLTISGDKTTQAFCITGSGSGYVTRNINQSGAMGDGPCDGQSGGVSYCPESSVVTINGYYCNGTSGSIATNNSSAVRLDATASEVPANAPAEYVGRQTVRDDFLGDTFSVAAGEVYCVSQWATTVSSAVTHAIGFYITGPSAGQQWNAPNGARIASSAALGVWKKLSGCYTIPSGYDAARLWTQNDGANGGTAAPAWYQTSVTLTKQ